MKPRQHTPVQIPRIAMPRRAIHVPSSPIDHGARVIRLIGVVIVRPDPRTEPRVPQRGTNILLCYACRLVRRLVHRHVAAALAVQGLVLQRDGVDGGALALVGLQVFHEVLRVLRVVLRVELVVVRVACEDLQDLADKILESKISCA